jgi:hypothetical protein
VAEDRVGHGGVREFAERAGAGEATSTVFGPVKWASPGIRSGPSCLLAEGLNTLFEMLHA